MSGPDTATLARLVAAQEGFSSAAPVRLTPLRGGAIQENWLLCVEGHATEYVLRTDAAATIRSSHSRAQEFALVTMASAAGVRVARPVLYCADAHVFGKPFAIYEKAAGTALGARIVKDMTLGGDRRAPGADTRTGARQDPPHCPGHARA